MLRGWCAIKREKTKRVVTSYDEAGTEHACYGGLSALLGTSQVGWQWCQWCQWCPWCPPELPTPFKLPAKRVGCCTQARRPPAMPRLAGGQLRTIRGLFLVISLATFRGGWPVSTEFSLFPFPFSFSLFPFPFARFLFPGRPHAGRIPFAA